MSRRRRPVTSTIRPLDGRQQDRSRRERYLRIVARAHKVARKARRWHLLARLALGVCGATQLAVVPLLLVGYEETALSVCCTGWLFIFVARACRRRADGYDDQVRLFRQYGID
jgi:hypothetical protein